MAGPEECDHPEGHEHGQLAQWHLAPEPAGTTGAGYNVMMLLSSLRLWHDDGTSVALNLQTNKDVASVLELLGLPVPVGLGDQSIRSPTYETAEATVLRLDERMR